MSSSHHNLMKILLKFCQDPSIIFPRSQHNFTKIPTYNIFKIYLILPRSCYNLIKIPSRFCQDLSIMLRQSCQDIARSNHDHFILSCCITSKFFWRIRITIATAIFFLRLLQLSLLVTAGHFSQMK